MAKETIILGLDFGTTYVTAGYLDSQGNIIHTVKQIPNCILFKDIHNGPLIFGAAAKDSDSQFTVFDYKKLIGREKTDVEMEDRNNWQFEVTEEDESGKIYIEFKDDEDKLIKRFHSEAVLAMIFYKIIEESMKNLPDHVEIEEVVIPSPVDFDERQREIIERALNVLGCFRVTIKKEPDCALFAFKHRYNADITEKDKILVIDFGGGTLDFSLCSYRENEFGSKWCYGDQNLGGIDFDNVLIKRIIAILSEENDYCNQLFKKKRETGAHKKKRKAVQRVIKRLAEKMKIKLSSSDVATVKINQIFTDKEIEDNDITIAGSDEIVITREDFELSCDELKKKINKCLRHKELKNIKPTKVLLIGGTCKIPFIQQLFRDNFNESIFLIKNDFDPLTAVADGAILLRHQNRNGIAEIPFETVPKYVGIEAQGKIYPFVCPGEQLPIERVQRFKNLFDNQTTASFKIYRGSELYPGENCKFLTNLNVNVPPKNRDEINYKVESSIDRSGKLRIKVYEESSGVEEELECKLDFYDRFEEREKLQFEIEPFCPIKIKFA